MSSSADAVAAARPHERHAGRWHDSTKLLAVLVVGGLILAAAWNSDYHSRIVAVTGLAIIAACGLNILTGITGQISLGHAGFYAVGAYTTALLSVRHGWPVLATIPVGLALCAVLGLLLAWPSLRLKGPYLTMVTIAFGLIIHGAAVDFTEVTNGPQGLFPVPPVTILGQALSLHGLNILLLAVVAVVVYLHAALINSVFGRAMRAVRGNELAAASLGVNVVWIKCLAFAISGVLAGLAGALFAPLNGFVNPDSFTLDLSIQLLLMVILGGRGTIWGPVAGAILLTALDRALAGLGDVRLVAYGAVLLGALYLVPEGLVGLLARLRARLRAARPASGAARAASVTTGISLPHAATPELTLAAVGKSFGGLKAVNAVSFRVKPGSIHGLVGPNGAGKTTVLNLISGVTAPSEGRILLGDRELGGRPVHRIAAAGVARTFQNLALFPDMTVLENVLVGQHLANGTTLVGALLHLPSTLRRERELERKAAGLLEFVGLAAVANEPAANLPQGHQRLLEIARALALSPALLLLDEPAAGLNATEVARLIEIVRRIGASGVSVLLIEHHMQLVMSVCEQITVLDFGRLIADGPPQVVRADPKVLEAYLGTPREAVAGGKRHAAGGAHA